MTQFAVVIPVFNPTPVFPQLLFRLNKTLQPLPGKWQIVLVDDGSSQWIKPPEIQIPITILKHAVNKGKGAALKTAFTYLISKSIPLQAVVILDADLQHLPEDIPRFLRLFQKTKADIILGVRKRTVGEMPIHRIASNYLTSLIISLLTGTLVKDSQCGFRFIRWDVLKSILPQLSENRFHLESEMLLQLGWFGYKIDHVSIPTIYNAQPSAIQNVPDTLNFVALITRMVWKRMWRNV